MPAKKKTVSKAKKKTAKKKSANAKKNCPECKKKFDPLGPHQIFCSSDCSFNWHMSFITSLKNSKGEWEGETFEPRPWQVDNILRPIFGVLGDDGLRKIQTCYIEIPCKNGKSTLCAAIALDMLVADMEGGAEVYIVAKSIDQADIIYNECVAMVRQSERLTKELYIKEAKKKVEYPRTNSFMRVLAADAATAEGINASCIIFDELHAQRDRKLYDTLKKRFGARRQPLMIMITTAGFDRESICYEAHEYAKKVQDGIVQDDEYHAYILAATDDDDWTNRDLWHKVNPALGDFKLLRNMEKEFVEALETPAAQNAFKRYHLNMWTEVDAALLNIIDWEQSAGTVNDRELVGRPCWGGLDMAEIWDLAAFVLTFKVGDAIKWLPMFWYPDVNIARKSIKFKAPLDLWAQQGFIKLTEGPVIDQNVIVNDIAELAKIFDIKEIGYDPWRCRQTAIKLVNEHDLEMVEMRQGHKTLGEATARMITELKTGNLHHGNNPVLNYMARNVVGRYDENNNVMPCRKKSKGKIDGIMAGLMGLARYIVNPIDGDSVYEQGDIQIWF